MRQQFILILLSSFPPCPLGTCTRLSDFTHAGVAASSTSLAWFFFTWLGSLHPVGCLFCFFCLGRPCGWLDALATHHLWCGVYGKLKVRFTQAAGTATCDVDLASTRTRRRLGIRLWFRSSTVCGDIMRRYHLAAIVSSTARVPNLPFRKS